MEELRNVMYVILNEVKQILLRIRINPITQVAFVVQGERS